MKDLIVTIVKALVDNPDQVEVEVVPEEGIDRYELKVAQEDLGKVIGKQGRTAQAMRTLLTVSSMKNGKKATLKILE